MGPYKEYKKGDKVRLINSDVYDLAVHLRGGEIGIVQFYSDIYSDTVYVLFGGKVARTMYKHQFEKGLVTTDSLTEILNKIDIYGELVDDCVIGFTIFSDKSGHIKDGSESKIISFDDLGEFDELMDLLIKRESNKSFEISINNDYTAKVKGDVVTVGCQTIQMDNIIQLVDKYKSINNKS